MKNTSTKVPTYIFLPKNGHVCKDWRIPSTRTKTFRAEINKFKKKSK